MKRATPHRKIQTTDGLHLAIAFDHIAEFDIAWRGVVHEAGSLAVMNQCVGGQTSNGGFAVYISLGG
jgi:hypothetical protein